MRHLATQQLIDHLVETFFALASRHLQEDVNSVLAKGYPLRAISAIGSAFASYGGRDLYPDEISKAAAMLVSLNRNHPLQNAVKRSSLSLVDYFLSEHGYQLEIDPGEGEAFLLYVANREVGYDDAHQWLLGNIKGRFVRRQLLKMPVVARIVARIGA